MTIEVSAKDTAKADNEAGRAADRQGDHEKAVVLLRKAVLSNPGNARYRYDLAEAYYNAGAMEYAKNVLDQVISMAPKSAEARSARALLSKIENERPKPVKDASKTSKSTLVDAVVLDDGSLLAVIDMSKTKMNLSLVLLTKDRQAGCIFAQSDWYKLVDAVDAAREKIGQIPVTTERAIEHWRYLSPVIGSQHEEAVLRLVLHKDSVYGIQPFLCVEIGTPLDHLRAFLAPSELGLVAALVHHGDDYLHGKSGPKNPENVLENHVSHGKSPTAWVAEFSRPRGVISSSSTSVKNGYVVHLTDGDVESQRSYQVLVNGKDRMTVFTFSATKGECVLTPPTESDWRKFRFCKDDVIEFERASSVKGSGPQWITSVYNAYAEELTATPTHHVVEYRVSGTVNHANLIWRDDSLTPKNAPDVKLPWTCKTKVKLGGYAQIEARGIDENALGILEIELWVDGSRLDSASSGTESKNPRAVITRKLP